MRYTTLGPTVQVSRICLGTAAFGVAPDAQEADRVVGTALDAGINFVDTADVYGTFSIFDRPGAPPAAELSRTGFPEAEIPVGRAVEQPSRDWGVQPYQASLAWLLARPAVASVIVGAETAGEVMASVSAVDIELDRAQLDSLTVLGADGRA